MNKDIKSYDPSIFHGESNGRVVMSDPKFDIKLQASFLNLALRDAYFCSQLVRYLGDDDDLKVFQCFDSAPYHFIFSLICECFKEFNTYPTEAQLRTSITNSHKYAEDEKDNFVRALDEIINIQIHNDAFLIKNITLYVRHVKSAKIFSGGVKEFKDNPSNVVSLLQSGIDEIRRIHFEKEDSLKLEDLDAVFTMRRLKSGQPIPSGLTDLDRDLEGGFPRESLVTILGASNSGKSLLCVSFACEALKAGFKVLHVNLEGTRDETLFRYYANLSDVEYIQYDKGDLDRYERQKADEITSKYNDNLKIINMLKFNVTIEELASYCRETYKDFPFDLLVVDYGQILKTAVRTETFQQQAEVYRGLDTLSKEFRCVVMTPAQSTREGIKKSQDGKALNVLRSHDLADCIEIARVSAIILSVNRNEVEEQTNQVRIFLEKQRRGAKAIVYGQHVNFKKCQLVTNKYFDPEIKSRKSRVTDVDQEPAQVIQMKDFSIKTKPGQKPTPEILKQFKVMSDERDVIRKKQEFGNLSLEENQRYEHLKHLESQNGLTGEMVQELKTLTIKGPSSLSEEEMENLISLKERIEGLLRQYGLSEKKTSNMLKTAI